MIGREEKALMVGVMEDAIHHLNRAIGVIDDISRRDIDTIRAVPEAADRVVIEGPELARALRAIIGRYQRGL